jgi:hypothetical protein
MDTVASMSLKPKSLISLGIVRKKRLKLKMIRVKIKLKQRPLSKLRLVTLTWTQVTKTYHLSQAHQKRLKVPALKVRKIIQLALLTKTDLKPASMLWMKLLNQS